MSGFYFNPKTDVLNPITNEIETVELQPLNTEGQGLEGYDKAYSKYGLAVPFGLGVKFSIGSRICVSAQWGFRKTFTDYIDDISKNYVSHEQMIEWGGELAASAADRTHELEGMETYYHSHNVARGNSATKDWYNFFGITLYDKGHRAYLFVRYDITKQLQLSFRYSITSYTDKETISSGNDMIASNNKQDVGIQLYFKF